MNNFREWLSDNLRYILLIFSILIVFVAMFFGVRALSKMISAKKDDSHLSLDSVVSSAPQPTSVQTRSGVDEHGSLQMNTPQEVTELMQSYYTALSNKDVSAMESITDSLTDDQKKQILESKAVYSSISVYTKSGFAPNSYIVYSTYQYQNEGSENLYPGLSQSYVEKGQDGKAKLILSELDTATSDYVKAVSGDEDVVELYNRVSAEFEAAQKQAEAASVVESVREAAASDVSAQTVQPSDDSSDDSEGASETYDDPEEDDDSEDDSDNDSDEDTDEGSDDDSDYDDSEQNDDSADEKEESSDEQDNSGNQDSYGSWSGVVIGPGEVNLRESTSNDSDVITVLNEGTRVTVMDEEGKWYLITTDEGRGYIAKKFIGSPEDYDGPEPSDEQDGETADHEEDRDSSWTGTVNCESTVNVRSGPGRNYSIIGDLDDGATVTVLYEKSGWYYVSADGIEGYVGHSYID